MLNYCIDSVHLPSVTIGVCIIIEPLEEDEKLVGRCVLLVKWYGVLDSMSTKNIYKNDHYYNYHVNINWSQTSPQ